LGLELAMQQGEEEKGFWFWLCLCLLRNAKGGRVYIHVSKEDDEAK